MEADKSDWSDEDLAAKEMDTPSWESDTSMDEEDKEELLSLLDERKMPNADYSNDINETTYAHASERETIFDEDEMSVSWDPDI